eukprot:6186641-Pleurochrysis_carterae.AAC.2
MRRRNFLSMLTYPAHLATKAQKEIQRPSEKNGNASLLPLTVKAFDELWRQAFRNNMIRHQDPRNALEASIALTQCTSRRHPTLR